MEESERERLEAITRAGSADQVRQEILELRRLAAEALAVEEGGARRGAGPIRQARDFQYRSKEPILQRRFHRRDEQEKQKQTAPLAAR